MNYFFPELAWNVDKEEGLVSAVTAGRTNPVHASGEEGVGRVFTEETLQYGP